ncbi:hypothetical protein [Jeotgalibacillus aurantiacus]|uniref:hypothetical protein n=1 Tax=Jeotgalibacillus aurantiacus TaxID=2763266 RepID=UPI001D09CA44|nr:hypothetical protein [Jeotgalibacillus aurantiacus]
MKKSVKIWTVSGIAYLGLVIIGYSLFVGNEEEPHSDAHEKTAMEVKGDSHEHEANPNEKENEQMENHQHHQHATHNDHAAVENEVSVTAAYEDGKIVVELKDPEGNAPVLETSHEKDLHLIVVKNDLSEYRHLHPVSKENGVFEQVYELPDGMYKVFVDIKPKGLAYQVKPVELHVGEHQNHSAENDLSVDTEFEKTVDGRTVALSVNSLKVNEPTVFTYTSKDGKPDPYLGALGHVVILDEDAEEFIHVHPSSEDETVFETHFSKPGIYKVWGEFKFGEQVHVYPFVIEVTE